MSHMLISIDGIIKVFCCGGVFNLPMFVSYYIGESLHIVWFYCINQTDQM